MRPAETRAASREARSATAASTPSRVRAVARLDAAGRTAIDVTLISVKLVGFYELSERCIPVFDHQIAAYESLIARANDGVLQGTPPLSFFDDSYPPYPTARSLRDLVAASRATRPRR
jgi:hypothetical protein